MRSVLAAAQSIVWYRERKHPAFRQFEISRIRMS
jgi:hypothetical protein